MNSKNSYRLLPLIGIGFLIISMFLSWYDFSVYDEFKTIVSSWSFSVLSGWQLSNGSDSFKPEENALNTNINMMSIILILYLLYFEFSNSRRTNTLRYTKLQSWMYLVMICLIGFQVISFPLVNLFGNDLYFPLMIQVDQEVKIIFQFSIGMGYMMQIASIIILFPHGLICFSVLKNLKLEGKHVKNDYTDNANLGTIIERELLELNQIKVKN